MRNIEDIIDVFIQLAFEEGQAYQRIHNKIGLDNVVDFKDIAYANNCGAQWNLKGDMQDLPKLFKTKNIKQDRIKALNEIAEQLQQIKAIAKQQLFVRREEVEYKEVIKGLESLIDDRLSFLGPDDYNDENNIFIKDIKVLKEAIKIIKEME